MFNAILRSLRGTNLEVFKFAIYISFPISWMWYFGTNLENRFTVEGFWPSQEQSHRIPYEREEIRDEVLRMMREAKARDLERGVEGSGKVDGEEMEWNTNANANARGMERLGVLSKVPGGAFGHREGERDRERRKD